MFIAALVTVAKTWKQPKCPSTEEWIKKIYTYIHIYIYTHTHNGILQYIVYCIYIYTMDIYTMEYYSVIKNEIMPFTAV